MGGLRSFAMRHPSNGAAVAAVRNPTKVAMRGIRRPPSRGTQALIFTTEVVAATHMHRVDHVSSMNTKRSGSRSGWPSNHASRSITCGTGGIARAGRSR